MAKSCQSCLDGGIKNDEKLRLTGIKGSIRWWYEVLVRGLGFYVCDPTDSEKACEMEISETCFMPAARK